MSCLVQGCELGLAFADLSYGASLWIRALGNGLGVSSLRPASLTYYLHFLFISSLELGIKGEGRGIVKRLCSEGEECGTNW